MNKKGTLWKKGTFCLLQNLGGHVPPVPPGSYVSEPAPRRVYLLVKRNVFLSRMQLFLWNPAILAAKCCARHYHFQSLTRSLRLLRSTVSCDFPPLSDNVLFTFWKFFGLNGWAVIFIQTWGGVRIRFETNRSKVFEFHAQCNVISKRHSLTTFINFCQLFIIHFHFCPSIFINFFINFSST